MRILAIRGENLASLAEPFEIAFDAEPLKAAGLFAITGETGAGKSTILDALCLALYDEFPRVKAAGADEHIPDGTNDPLRATDPRTILRRGAGRGYAEVDFLARDGAVYRARCELNRARGRASGALQQRRRALWKVAADGALEPLASSIGEVKARIEALTELTCDQFRRTVLLAQGDFDAFLRADARERAELLEKITGTQIYADVSRRAFERHKEARDALLGLERQRDGIGLLDPEARAGVEAELAALAERKALETAAREEIASWLRRHETIAAATAKRDRAAEALAAEQAAWEALGEDRARLTRLDDVEPLRGAWEKVRDGEDTQRAAQDAQAARGAALARAAEALAAAQGGEAAAREALASAEAACAAFDPAWAQAADLDRRIAEAGATGTRLAAAHREAAAEAERAAEQAQAIARRIEAAQAEDARLAESLARDAALEPLATGFAELSEALAKRAEFVREAAELRRARDEAAATIARIADARTGLDAADAQDAEVRAACEARIAARGEVLEALGEAVSRARAEGLETADGVVARLASAADKARDADAARWAATARRDAAAATFTAAREAARAAQAQLQALDARADEVERLGALAEATASEQAHSLRATLVPGEPCPVCGEPHAPKPDEAPDAFVAEIRARRDALRRDQDAARTRRAEADATAEAAERAGREAAAAITAETERLDAVRSAYADARSAFTALADLGLAPPPDDWAEANAALGELTLAIAEARAGIRETLRRAEVLRADISAERTRRDRAVAAVDGRRGERSGLDREESVAREAIARADTRLPDLEDRRASIDRKWERVLAATGVDAADLDRDTEAARRMLEARATDYRTRVERRAELAQDLARDREALSGAQATVVAARKAHGAAETACGNAASALAGLREARAGLLDGEPTEPHRRRYVDAAKAGRAGFDAAREALEAARRAHAVAQTDARNAETTLAAATARLATSESGLADALAARALPRAEALALLATPPEERESLRTRLKLADDAVSGAKSALVHCRSSLAEAVAAGVPQEDVATLQARRAELDAALAALAEEEVAKRAALRQDDAARAQAGALAAEIAKASDVARLWAEINDAIGSSDGSKFRRYAQSVTLDHLVALANRHLAALSPRYRLERAGGEGGDLGLQILDRDLGDERRSTRSLSGGERFLTSLALALALCSLEGRGSFVDTLFIDEGFGTLDAATLDVAIDALETLQAQGRKVGVISHVESMHQRIPVQIRVEKSGGGRSRVRLVSAGALGLAA